MNEIRNWTWHILAGILIFVLLGMHMIIMHLGDILGWFSVSGVAINWADVLERSKSILFVIVYTLLLAAALYHGLYGLRNILFEFTAKKSIQKGTNALLWVVGVGLFSMGTYATIVTYSH